MNTEFLLPAAQHPMLDAFLADGRLRGAVSPCASWMAARAIRAGDRCPVVSQGDGTVWLQEAVWGHSSAESSELTTTASPDGPQSAWRCLVPMVWSGHPDKPWCLVAGFWRQEDRRDPESFVVLTRPASSGTGQRVLMIDPQHWLDWLNPQLDKRWLYAKSWHPPPTART